MCNCERFVPSANLKLYLKCPILTGKAKGIIKIKPNQQPSTTPLQYKHATADINKKVFSNSYAQCNYKVEIIV